MPPGENSPWPGQKVEAPVWPGQRIEQQRQERADQAQERVDTGVDMARSLGTGIQQGISGFLGMAGDAREGAAMLLRHLGLNERDADLAARLWTGPLTGGASINSPSTGEITETIENVQGRPQYEPQTTAGEYARTVGQFAPAVVAPVRAAAAAAPNATARIAQQVAPMTRASRAVTPAVASETAGQLTEGTEAEPWARLIAGLAGGGVNEGFVHALRRNGRTPDERALRLIMREMNDQGMSEQEIVDQANRLLTQAPTEEVLAEVLGPGGLRLARATAALGRGAGRSTAEEALSARAEGRPSIRQTATREGQRPVTSIRDRIMDEAARMTAPSQTRAPRDYWDALDALRTARGSQGREAYRAAHAFPGDDAAATVSFNEGVNSQLIGYMRDAPREWFTSGVRQLETEASRARARMAEARLRNANDEALAGLSAELEDILSARQQLASFASGEIPNTVNARAIDYFQRGILQMERAAGRGSPEAGALSEARGAYNQMADRINPAFADARSRYGESIRIEDYMNEGRRVFNMSDGEIDRLMRANGRGLTTEEFDGFMLGVMDAIEQKLGASDTGFLARLMRNQNWREQLTTAVGGEQQARRFLNRLAREANMQGTRNFVQSGSRTQPIAEDIAALTQGEAELAFLSDNARALIASGGSVRPLAIRWALSAYDRFNRPGLRNPEVQEQMARRLFTRVTRESSQELRDALLALRQDTSLRPEVRQWLNRMLSAESAVQESEDHPATMRDDYINARRIADDAGAQ